MDSTHWKSANCQSAGTAGYWLISTKTTKSLSPQKTQFPEISAPVTPGVETTSGNRGRKGPGPPWVPFLTSELYENIHRPTALPSGWLPLSGGWHEKLILGVVTQNSCQSGWGKAITNGCCRRRQMTYLLIDAGTWQTTHMIGSNTPSKR